MTPCGCRIEYDDPARVGPAPTQPLVIRFCPLHQAAEQMREALKALLQTARYDKQSEALGTYLRAERALAASEGKEGT